MPPPAEIITLIERTRVDDLARVSTVMHVVYRLGEHGPFTLIIPQAEFTVEEVQRRLAAEAGKLGALLGLP